MLGAGVLVGLTRGGLQQAPPNPCTLRRSGPSADNHAPLSPSVDGWGQGPGRASESHVLTNIRAAEGQEARRALQPRFRHFISLMKQQDQSAGHLARCPHLHT